MIMPCSPFRIRCGSSWNSAGSHGSLPRRTRRRTIALEAESTGYCAARDVATTADGLEPGPWAGEVRRLVAGLEIETRLVLEAHDDPIAEHHTLGGRRISALDPSLLGLAGPAVRRDGRDDRAGGRAGRRARAGPHGLKGGSSPQVGALRGGAGLPGAPRAAYPFDRTTTASGSASSIGARTARPRPPTGLRGGRGLRRSVPPAPAAVPWSLEDPPPSQFTAESVYAEQWLFHGPAFQAIADVGQLSDRGIDGTPARAAAGSRWSNRASRPTFHTDLIVIDSFTHLLGCWGLDHLAEGDVVFPLRMEELEIYGERPPVGTDVACRSPSRRSSGTASASRPRSSGRTGRSGCGSTTGRTGGSTGRAGTATSFRQPRDYLVGEELPLDDPRSGPLGGKARLARATGRHGPARLARRAGAHPARARGASRAPGLGGPEERRSHRLWGRIAAKEAHGGSGTRRPGRVSGRPGDRHRRTRPAPADPRGGLRPIDSLPAISIADADGVAVAFAALDPRARSGIDVEPIVDRRPASRPRHSRRTNGRCWIDGTEPGRAEWVDAIPVRQGSRGQGVGVGPGRRTARREVVGIDEDSGRRPRAAR